jgi:hypothetical protein
MILKATVFWKDSLKSFMGKNDWKSFVRRSATYFRVPLKKLVIKSFSLFINDKILSLFYISPNKRICNDFWLELLGTLKL